jgi:hypothetical protein
VFDTSLDGESQLTLDFLAGMGTPPTDLISVGIVARALPHLGDGTDLALALRGATRGYTNGDWGVALDAGAYQRFWGIESTGFLGNASLGLPWGLVLNASAGFGTNDSRMVLATFGVDFARLTVYRTTGQSWWKNPFPAVRER